MKRSPEGRALEADEPSGAKARRQARSWTKSPVGLGDSHVSVETEEMSRD